MFEKGISAGGRKRLVCAERWGLRAEGDVDAVVDELVVCRRWPPGDVTGGCGGVPETGSRRGRTEEGVDDVLVDALPVDDEGEDCREYRGTACGIESDALLLV